MLMMSSKRRAVISQRVGEQLLHIPTVEAEAEKQHRLILRGCAISVSAQAGGNTC